MTAPLPTPAREHVESSDGVAVVLHHLAAGPAGSPLLVAHATGFHGRCYEPMALALAEHFDVWALDFRGHGATAAAPDQPVVWERYGDDAAAAARWVTDRAGAPAAGFGHSMGGAALLMAALADPGRFRGLVLYEPIVFPPADGPPATSPLAEGARRRRPSFPSLDEAYRNFASKPPMRDFEPAALRAYVDGGLTPVDPAAPDGPVRLCCRPEYEAATYLAAPRHHVWDELPVVDVPVVVVGGVMTDDDQPGALAPRVAERIPGGRYDPHPELDHFGPFAAPTATAAIVARSIPDR